MSIKTNPAELLKAIDRERQMVFMYARSIDRTDAAGLRTFGINDGNRDKAIADEVRKASARIMKMIETHERENPA